MAKAPVLLRDLDAKGTPSQPFEADHAANLLAYPNTRWEKVEDTPADEKKPVAAAAKKVVAPAAAVATADADRLDAKK